MGRDPFRKTLTPLCGGKVYRTCKVFKINPARLIPRPGLRGNSLLRGYGRAEFIVRHRVSDIAK